MPKPRPYVRATGELIIPFSAPDRYKYWKEGGFTMRQVIEMLDVTEETREALRRRHLEDHLPRRPELHIEVKRTTERVKNRKQDSSTSVVSEPIVFGQPIPNTKNKRRGFGTD